jgi:hypothetical protein
MIVLAQGRRERTRREHNKMENWIITFGRGMTRCQLPGKDDEGGAAQTWMSDSYFYVMLVQNGPNYYECAERNNLKDYY